MSTERATTIGRAQPFRGYAESPEPPSGKYWKLVGSAAAQDAQRTDEPVFFLFWFWEREAP